MFRIWDYKRITEDAEIKISCLIIKEGIPSRPEIYLDWIFLLATNRSNSVILGLHKGNVFPSFPIILVRSFF